MARTATDNDLLTFEEYFKYKEEKFNKKHVEVDDLDPEEFLNDKEFNTQNRSKFRPYLEILLKHIRNRGVFMGDDRKPCSYVSYILSKELLTKIYEYKPETFKMFQDFVSKYNSRPGYTAEICSNNLIYVISDIYDKMYKLYELYERYQNIKRNHFPGDPESCSVVNFFLLQYKEFTNEYKVTDRHFKKVLEDFRNKIHNSLQLYNQIACIQNRFKIENVKFYDSSENNMPKASVEERQRSNAGHQVSETKRPSLVAISSSPVSISSSPVAISPPPVVISSPPVVISPQSHEELQASYPKVQTYRAEPERTHEQPQPTHETLAPSTQHVERQEVQRLPYRGIPEREVDVDLSQANLPYNGSLESSETSSYPEHNRYPAVLQLGNEEKGTSSAMTTITSALRDVEPGPVLVVSGGMGVLFLLFKYTPVGSFFGGRRGRFRQIPRTFGGFPPGDFGNFQEYGGGYVGYSQMDMPFQGE